jgi:hypothetical protein
MTQHYTSGDPVAWNTAQGETHGTVVKTVVKPTRVKGHLAKASRDRPQVLVRSAKSGAEAVHTPESLRRGGSG